ncbi:uncharacterized protein DS421_16g545410 [Arachis hypogaea]|nr:uncharacterized protein DS421_16g545410 [Arachis hypogaea]
MVIVLIKVLYSIMLCSILLLVITCWCSILSHLMNKYIYYLILLLVLSIVVSMVAKMLLATPSPFFLYLLLFINFIIIVAAIDYFNSIGSLLSIANFFDSLSF